MPSASPTPKDLDGYREDADRFIAELDEEYYFHFAGLKDKLELEPIYERHQDLTTLEWTHALGESVDGDRRIRELWRFACEGHLGNLTKEHSEKAAALETELEAEVDGEKVGFRMLRPTIANTDDRGKRERLDKARTQLTEEHLNPIYLDAVEISQRTVPKLGSPNYVDLYRRFGRIHADDRPGVQAGRALHDLGPQGQRALVQVRERDGVHLQRPRDGLRQDARWRLGPV